MIPQAAVISVVLRGAEVLLVRRRNPPNAGFWGFPGGRIEPGEPLAAAAVRELREETGVEAEFVRVFDAADAVSESHHYVLVACLCRWRAGEPAAADDAIEAGWFPVTALDHAPAPLIERVAEMARAAPGVI